MKLLIEVGKELAKEAVRQIIKKLLNKKRESLSMPKVCSCLVERESVPVDMNVVYNTRMRNDYFVNIPNRYHQGDS